MKIKLRIKKETVVRIVAAGILIPAVYITAIFANNNFGKAIGSAAAFMLEIDYNIKPAEYSGKDAGVLGIGSAVSTATSGKTDEINNEENEVKPAEAAPESEKPTAAGTITRTEYKAGESSAYIAIGDGYIKNCTSLTAEEILKTANQKPDIKILANGTPEVLIMHTHTTECYQNSLSPWYDLTAPTRTRDAEKNVVRVGEEIEKQLKANGIGVIHDKTEHDYPSYTGAYDNSRRTVTQLLKKYPTIKIVLDVHRDAIQPSDTEIIAPVVNVNGKDAAQVMIISGADNGKLNMPNYLENLKFSAALQRTLSAEYKTLARPVLFDYRKYNQDLTTGSILLEMGGHGNTLEEAIYCGELVGKSLSHTLLNMR